MLCNFENFFGLSRVADVFYVIFLLNSTAEYNHKHCVTVKWIMKGKFYIIAIFKWTANG